MVIVTPVPDDAMNFNFSTEATENGVVYRGKATLPGGQEWFSLQDGSPTTSNDCLSLAVTARTTFEGEHDPVLHGRVARTDAQLLDGPPFNVGFIPDGATAPEPVPGSWLLSPDGHSAWAEYDALSGALTYALDGEPAAGEDPAAMADPFWLTGWRSQAPVLIDNANFWHFLGDPNCATLPTGGDGCSWLGGDDWSELDSFGENVQRFPRRGLDGTYHCALINDGAQFPYVFTGRSARGVDVDWFDRQVAASYCHTTGVDLGMDGRLLQCQWHRPAAVVGPDRQHVPDGCAHDPRAYPVRGTAPQAGRLRGRGPARPRRYRPCGSGSDASASR